MESVLYLDEYILINGLMDYVIIGVDNRLLDLGCGRPRKLMATLAGVIGAVIYALSEFRNNPFFRLGIHIVTCVIMALIMAYKRIDRIIRLILLLNITCFFTAGIMNYFYYEGILSRIIHLFTVNKIIGFCSALGCTILIGEVVVARLSELAGNYAGRVYEVTITHKERRLQVKALLDTGNTLKEPISGNIVHIIEYELLEKLIANENLCDERLAVIPYHSIGRSQGLLYGIYVDSIMIHKKEDVILNNSIVAAYKGRLAADKSYSMLLNADVNDKQDII